jgi:hypothetical protein
MLATVDTCAAIGGSIMEGSFEKDRKQTFVEKEMMDMMEHPSGIMFKGCIVGDKPRLVGEMELTKDIRYIGEFNEDGVISGQGEMKYSNGRHFVGEFKDGKFVYGKMSFEDGIAWYEGEFAEQVGHGQGKAVNSAGEIFEGNFVNSWLSGQGS